MALKFHAPSYNTLTFPQRNGNGVDFDGAPLPQLEGMTIRVPNLDEKAEKEFIQGLNRLIASDRNPLESISVAGGLGEASMRFSGREITLNFKNFVSPHLRKNIENHVYVFSNGGPSAFEYIDGKPFSRSIFAQELRSLLQSFGKIDGPITERGVRRFQLSLNNQTSQEVFELSDGQLFCTVTVGLGDLSGSTGSAQLIIRDGPGEQSRMLKNYTVSWVENKNGSLNFSLKD